jgi:hypothetical protein
MIKTLLQVRRPARTQLTCTWSQTGNPRRPLVCIWSTTATRRSGSASTNGVLATQHEPPGRLQTRCA